MASFFISWVGTKVDRRLGEVIVGDRQDDTGEIARLHGQAAIANARLAYQAYERMLVSQRWQALKAMGARPQRLLWASGGMKDGTYADTRYAVELAGPDTVNTMPEATLQAVVDHGKVQGDKVRGGYEAAWAVLDGLGCVGVGVAEVADTLEARGIASFATSWDELIASVTAQMEKAGALVMPAGAVTPASGDGGQDAAPAARAPPQQAAGGTRA